jgi:hypothetical protein
VPRFSAVALANPAAAMAAMALSVSNGPFRLIVTSGLSIATSSFCGASLTSVTPGCCCSASRTAGQQFLVHTIAGARRVTC